MNNRLLLHYQQELALAHHLAEEFAKAHPKIAGRLRLDGKNIGDPETTRLLQTFALSNARISHRLEDDFSFLSDALLNTLHPHLYAPLPAFSIVQFEPDAIKLNSKLVLDKHLMLKSATKNEELCFFRTCFDVDIFPIVITEAELISKPAVMPAVSFFNQANAFLRIRLEGLDDKVDLTKSGIEKLRLFIHFSSSEAYKLYDLIFNHCIGVVAATNTTDISPIILPLSDIQPVGFQPEEELLPYGQATPCSYRLLTEFFAFPEKFLFFDINHLSHIIANKCYQPGDGLEIIFYLNQTDLQLEKKIKPDNLRLACTPVINLFNRDIDRIEINATQQKYLLPTDKNLEIYHVDQVTVYFDDQHEKALKPFFADQFSFSSLPHYHVMRKPAWEGGEYLKPGSEIFLYFQDIQNFFLEYKNPQISSKVLCTNRDLPAHLDTTHKNTVLSLVENKTDALRSICFLKKLSLPSRPFMQPGLRWQYLSTLNLNYFSLTNDQEGLDALRNLLDIYMTELHIKAKDEILRGLLLLQTQMITVRSTHVRENSFSQGIKISLRIDEAIFDSMGLYLFCYILSHFFTAWFSKNLTIILVVYSSSGKELYSGEPRRGERQ